MKTNMILLTAVLTFLFGSPTLARAESVEGRLNILLVMVDDMGWTDVGSFGSEIETPNLDSLAEQGVKFTSFYASVSCSPTRSNASVGDRQPPLGSG